MSTASKPDNPTTIDPRGPRFGAGLTSVWLLLVLALGIPGASVVRFDGAFWILVIIAVLFAWGSVWGPSRHPYATVFRRLIQPRLGPPDYLEDEAPPRFAQLVGLLVTVTGLVLHLLGVPFALVIAAAAAFVAAFLNAVFGLCLGCELYTVLLRLRAARH